MPATSKAQQQAAGIAHAVEKGDLPKSKLKGASKQMYKGMAGSGELHKFAATKTGGLPKHVKESTEAVANLFGRTLNEGGHKAGCQCGFCKNKGSFGKKAKDDEKAKEKKMSEPTEPESSVEEAEVRQLPYFNPKTKQVSQVPWITTKPKDKKPVAASGTTPTPGMNVKEAKVEGQVKLSTGTTKGSANKAYHNMTSKQAMTPGWKPKQYIKAAAEATNQTGRMKGFKSQSQAETTGGKKLESGPSVNAKKIVEALLG